MPFVNIIDSEEHDKQRRAVHYASQAVLATALALVDDADDNGLGQPDLSLYADLLKSGRRLKAALIEVNPK